MRGKAKPKNKNMEEFRITPAYAGKSIFINTFLQLFKDHPRLCGEKFAQYDAAFWEWGSPPPMRGKAPFSKSKPTFTGITPAYAGKSTIFQIKTDIHRDHPRLCGEKFSNCDEKTTCGITPAYAGKSFNFCQNRCICQDHPRLCGEKLLCYVPLPAGIGSPPPMRGKAWNFHLT